MSDDIKTEGSVSVIGLGSMGSGIAQAFISAGYQVSVWNRSRGKVDAMVSNGAIACDRPEDALKANTHVVVCLTDYSAWRQIIKDHDLDSHFEGSCIIQLTTGTIDEVQAHSSFIEEHGGRVVDGAVMCYPSQLGTDDGSILIAGASEVLDECSPFLRVLASNWTNLGEDIKQPTVLSRSLIAGVVTSLVGFVNGIAICRAGGISLDVFMKHVNKVNAILPDEKTRLVEAIRDNNTEKTQASIKSWGEGHQAVCSIAETLETNLILQDAVQSVFQEGQRLGLGDHDLSALINVFASKAKIECEA